MKMRESAAYAVGATAFILCATFAAFAIWIHQAVEHNAYEQALLRTAQIERARLIRLQLDKETGIRGYVLTRKTLFLEPYATGRRHFGATAATLRTTLTDLGMDDRLVASKRRSTRSG